MLPVFQIHIGNSPVPSSSPQSVSGLGNTLCGTLNRDEDEDIKRNANVDCDGWTRGR